MHTTITARHCEISEELRARADAVLRRLGELAERPVDGTIVFDVAANAFQAEIRLHVSRGDTFVGTATEKDHRSALDRAEEKVRRQLDKTDQPVHRNRRAKKDAV
jgi:ribosomal subunit interface protein